jgi:hypothetical protein
MAALSCSSAMPRNPTPSAKQLTRHDDEKTTNSKKKETETTKTLCLIKQPFNCLKNKIRLVSREKLQKKKTNTKKFFAVKFFELKRVTTIHIQPDQPGRSKSEPKKIPRASFTNEISILGARCSRQRHDARGNISSKCLGFWSFFCQRYSSVVVRVVSWLEWRQIPMELRF